MNRKPVFILSLLLLLSCFVYLGFTRVEVKASNGYPVHNLDTGLEYTTIQEAINANETLDGHTIFVEEGTYCEHPVVDKSLSLIGEDKSTTIVDGNGTGTVIDVTYNITAIINVVANNVNISGFTVRNGGFHGIVLLYTANCTVNSISSLNSTSCISLINSNNNRIADSEFSNGSWGVFLFNSTENKVVGNTVLENLYAGIAMGGPEGSSKNVIANNTISLNVNPVFTDLGYGIDIVGSDNKIFHNNISNNSHGILLDMAYHNRISRNFISDNKHFGIRLVMNSRNNTIIENTIQGSNSFGLYMEYGKNNFIYHNNFVDNKGQAYSGDLASYGNVWSNGLEGNYWSEYKGEDNDNDGIGDTPYTIYEYDQDNHPLMGKFYDFNATPEHHVQTICNSTITDFQFNGTAILFDVSGENGTASFCRMCIPKALMNEMYRVFVNGTEVTYIPLTDISNMTHNYIYFNYAHSTQEVIIIPEFPSFLILPLFMMATLLAVVVYKRKHTG